MLRYLYCFYEKEMLMKQTQTELDLNFMFKLFAQAAPTHNKVVTGIKIDSRAIEPGNLFVALDGSQQDGHAFMPQAIKNGAIAALVSKPIVAEIPTIIVDDTVEALGRLGAKWRDCLTMPIVGVTGSCGKTTVKQMVAAILQASCGQQRCYLSPGNYNSITGVPLSLLQLNDQHAYAVLEMGMNRFGEIAATSAYARPDVVAINSVAPVHTEHVGDVAGVAKAKGEILQGLSASGAAVLSADSPFLKQWQVQLKAQQRLLTFGESPEADVQLTAVNEQFNYCEFTLMINNNSLKIKLSIAGKYNAMNAACAAAVAKALDIDHTFIEQGLASFQSSPGRFQRLAGIHQSIIIDDSYNANPVAVKAAIDVLKHYSGKKILLLGSMFELGEHEREYHAQVGQYAKAQGIDCLLAIGELAKEAVSAYGEGAQFFTDREQLLIQLRSALDQDSCLLVKGSNAMNMQQFVLALSL